MRARLLPFQLALLCLLRFAAPAAAQADMDYVVGPGDVLKVDVARHPEFNVAELAVPATPVVMLPVVGKIQLAGHSLRQINEDYLYLLKLQLAKPVGSVTLVRGRDKSVKVVGLVTKPGKLPMRERWRITDALTGAGGLKISSDRLTVAVYRGGRKLEETPLQPLIANPNSNDNLRLQDGDRIELVANSIQVTVTGEVQKPGVINAPMDSGVLDVLDLAGGATEEAALGRVTLTASNGKIRTLDLRKPTGAGSPPVNSRIAEGDTIAVPALKSHVSVLGAVRRPGFYGLEEGRKLTVSDALKRAGGGTNKAVLLRSRLLRANGDLSILDLTATDATELSPDDVLTIPEAKEVSVEGEVANPGQYVLLKTDEPRVTDALSVAGGLKRDLNDSRISVIRKLPNDRRIELRVDAQQLMAENDLSQNVLLQNGDTVKVVPGQRLVVVVGGEVRQPGVFDVLEGAKLATILGRAGGFTPWAKTGSVAIVRRDQGRLEVDGNAALRDDPQANLELLDGDQVSVPKLDSWRLGVGDASKTTEYPYPETGGLTVQDALAQSGADKTLVTGKLAIARVTGTGLRRVTVDPKAKAETGGGLKTPLQAGDILIVPAPKAPSSK